MHVHTHTYTHTHTYNAYLILADRQDQPVFGQPLEDHLRAYKCEIAVVIEDCISAIRESWMDTEGLFRLAASSAKIKFLKVNAFHLRFALSIKAFMVASFPSLPPFSSSECI